MFLFKYFVFLITVSISSQSTLENLIGLSNFRNLRSLLFNGLGHTSENQEILSRARQLNTVQKVLPNSVPFPCPVDGFRSTFPPKSVHLLKPGDIDIIGAMGDSLTVGVGLITVNTQDLVSENRGLSWSIGGQGTWREFLTLPNILKNYNPNLFGYALSDSLTIETNSQFNVAETGAISEEMPYMAKVLVKRITKDPRVNVENHWKLITYMIGPNDFCTEICYSSRPDESVERFRQIQITVLRTLRDNLPKTIVNIVPTPHLRELRTLSESNKPKLCRPINIVECPCMFGSKFQGRLEYYYQLMDKWQLVNDEVANLPEFDREDFTVVNQPFVTKTSVPKLPNNLTDYTYMSQDCFHLSQKLNAEVANGLWNNMFEPVGQKSLKMDRLFEKFLCPTTFFPYIYTKHNSVNSIY